MWITWGGLFFEQNFIEKKKLEPSVSQVHREEGEGGDSSDLKNEHVKRARAALGLRLCNTPSLALDFSLQSPEGKGMPDLPREQLAPSGVNFLQQTLKAIGFSFHQ